jgi:spore photoproduct lyase
MERPAPPRFRRQASGYPHPSALREASITSAAKAQLAAEIILLTHNAELHETNLAWHPKAEAVLWRPDLQETKRSESGTRNLRYRAGLKRRFLDELLGLMREVMPYCRVRYAF